MKSMTGYAARDAEGRRWDVRSVNARGLDVRLRLPDTPSGLEPMAREMVAKVAARGNVTVSLKVAAAGEGAARLSPEGLDAALDAVAAAQLSASAKGIALTPPSAADVLSLRGVWETGEGGSTVSLETCRAEFAEVLAAFDADRAREGASLHAVLTEQVEEIARLTQAATDMVDARADHMAGAFRAAVARLVEAAPEAGLDGPRTAQEIAALAVKGDITEELDRLRSHVAAARELLASDAPVGRRLDFLTQEFNREANTLCSKSSMAELTAIGLDLKAVIDRLREQVQNVE